MEGTHPFSHNNSSSAPMHSGLFSIKSGMKQFFKCDEDLIEDELQSATTELNFVQNFDFIYWSQTKTTN